MSFAQALKWSFLSEFAAKAIQPVVFIVLARLLTPEDFGVMSAALMVIGFSQIFWEAGMGKALIQRQNDVEGAANVAFWINIILGFIIAGFLYLVANPVAYTFFQDDRVAAVLQVMTIQIFLGAVSAVHIALLQREMGFKKLFWVRFATITFPGMASIPLAWNGMGYWALVAGTLVGQFLQAIMLWYMSDWRPKWSFDTKIAKETVRFGAWVAASGLLAWFYLWADSLIVGMFLGSHELGIYRTGNQFAAMIFTVLFGPIVPVLYSYLSRMNQDRERLRGAIDKIIKVLTIVGIPAAIILFALSEPISVVFFGDKWQGIGLVIGVMALSHGVAWVTGMNGEAYRAMGKPSFETIPMVCAVLVYLIGYIYSIQKGFEVFVWTRLLLTLCGLLLQLLVLRNLTRAKILPKLSYMMGIAASVAAPMYLVTIALGFLVLDSWSQILLECVLMMVLGIGVVYFIERNGAVKEIQRMVKRRVI